MGNLLSVVREPASADNFILFVAMLARDLKSHVHLIYVEEEYEYTIGRPPAHDNYAGDEQAKRISQAGRVLSERVDTVLGHLKDELSLEYSSELASLVSVVDDFVSLNNPDMVILDAEEPRGIMYANTTNDELIDEIKCPVLIIPRNAVYRPLRQIVYATAHNEKDIIAVKDLIKITSAMNPSIRIVHIKDESVSGEQLGRMSFIEIIQRETMYPGISAEYPDRDRNESISGQIMDYAVSVNADMLVVLKDDRSFFERIFNPDKTKKVAKNSDLPVLVYKV